VVQPVLAAQPRRARAADPRARDREILGGLPVGETFDWVDRVSIELTTGMLATLFDFPYEQRRKLTHWSDMATASPVLVGSDDATEEERQAVADGMPRGVPGAVEAAREPAATERSTS
jgi:cytochrome P450